MAKSGFIGRWDIVVAAAVCLVGAAFALCGHAQASENALFAPRRPVAEGLQLKKIGQPQALFMSLGRGDIAYFRRLLKAGADPNAAIPGTGKTLLMAVERTDMLELLLEFGADPGRVDHDGATALHYAVGAADALHIIPRLIEKGAPVNARAPGWSEQTPLMVAAKLYSQGKDPVRTAKVLRLLAEHGAEVNTADDSGNTILIQAVVNDKPDLVRLMIELGADASMKAHDGLSALDWAQELGFLDIVELLESSSP
jgi:ankyrin repeat protein